jgi:hypothetical protein
MAKRKYLKNRLEGRNNLLAATAKTEKPLSNPLVQMFLGVMFLCVVVVGLKLDLPKPFDLLTPILFIVVLALIGFGLAYLGLWLWHWHLERSGLEYAADGDEPETARAATASTTLSRTNLPEGVRRQTPTEMRLWVLQAEGMDEMSGWEILNNPELRAGRVKRLNEGKELN